MHMTKQVQADSLEIWYVDAERENVFLFWIINCKDIGLELPDLREQKRPTCKENQR